MGEKIQKIKKLKNVRIHREGTNELLLSAGMILAIGYLLLTLFDTRIPFWIFNKKFTMVFDALPKDICASVYESAKNRLRAVNI